MTRSANSGGSSKRGGASSSLRGVSSGKKRSLTKSDGSGGNQQTLGMAWGANSSSASRSSFWRSPFSDFGSYMMEKNTKLQEQFCAEASCPSNGESSLNSLFKEVSTFVDGLTVPSCQELRVNMLKYGGRLQNYFSRHRVTHIICSNLPCSKIKIIRSFSAGLPVVKPNWIMDCIASNKLLSWVPYQLDQLADNQSRLSNFFGLQGVVSEGISSAKIEVLPENEQSFSKCLIPNELKLSEVSDVVGNGGHVGVVESLPPELFSELNEIYRGKLAGLSFHGRGSKDAYFGRRDAFDPCSHSDASNIERMEVEKEGVNVLSNEVAGLISTSMKSDLMPTSLSQIDSLVLQQLPKEVRESIVQLLPAHRDQFVPAATLSTHAQNGQLQSTDQCFNNNEQSAHEDGLWSGNPPLWIDKYKMSNCRVLNILAELYGQSKESSALSHVLQFKRMAFPSLSLREFHRRLLSLLFSFRIPRRMNEILFGWSPCQG